MTTPVVPFVTGALVGSLAMFLYMDKGSQKKIRAGAASAAEKVSQGAQRVKKAVEPEKETAKK